jgi:hypothetical protein
LLEHAVIPQKVNKKRPEAAVAEYRRGGGLMPAGETELTRKSPEKPGSFATFGF